jgi:hypothetical protein
LGTIELSTGPSEIIRQTGPNSKLVCLSVQIKLYYALGVP